MPDLLRQPFRFDCSGGINLVEPIDRMSPGNYAYLFNCRVLEEGRIDGRPGYGQFISMADTPNSIRRLNDSAKTSAPAGYIYLGGGGPNLYGGIESAYHVIDTGYSGDPLSLIAFRPDQSPESWMYVYDRNKNVKVRPDGTVRQVGLAPPTKAPSIEYGVPEQAPVALDGNVTGWVVAATPEGSISILSTILNADRATSSNTPTINSILYMIGSNGWALINPTEVSGNFNWAGDRMVINLGSTESVTVREIHPAITATTIAGISYDTGTSGPCSIVLTNSPSELSRNSLIQIGAEVMRVMAVILSPDGQSYSIRVSTNGTANPGDTVTGLVSWYTYTALTHTAGEAITTTFKLVTMGAAANSTASVLTNLDLSKSSPGSRPVSIADDWMHLSMYFDEPTNVSAIKVQVDLDAATVHVGLSTFTLPAPHTNNVVITLPSVINTAPTITVGGVIQTVGNALGGVQFQQWYWTPGSATIQQIHYNAPFAPSPVINGDVVVSFVPGVAGNAFTRNYLTWTLDVGQINPTLGWNEILVPISAAVRTGSDFTRNLSTVSALGIEVDTTGPCNWGFDSWYLFGTYGPVIQPNAPVGYQYQSRFRVAVIGDRSVPGPLNRIEIFPLREDVIVTPQTTTQPGVDTIDIYRLGGNLPSPLYVASVPNVPALPVAFLDGLPDSFILQVNQSPDLGAIQPFPILQASQTGLVNVVGTSVTWVGGTQFNLNMLGNTAITINGVVFLTYGQPSSPTTLEITQDAGNLVGVPYQIFSPTLAAQHLPLAFGPLEGPFAPIVFALGDPLNGGVLYFTNFNDADSASDANTLELTEPSNNLISGAVWNGLTFAGSRQDVFVVRYSYLTTIGASNNTTFQFQRVSTPSGMWSRWACCSCPIGVAYLGRDGIYICTENTGINITDEKLYPLFDHDGQPAHAVNSGSNIILPVDMTKLTNLRLTYADESLWFSYIDTGGNANSLQYEIYHKRWLLHNYGDGIGLHYLVEQSDSDPNRQEILLLSVDQGKIYLSGGNTDAGADINSIVLTPSMDNGDERTQKLVVDTMLQVEGLGVIEAAVTFDNAQRFGPVMNIPCLGSIQQVLQNVASQGDLTLCRNVGVKLAWVGGPDGPKVTAWEYSGFLQPMLTSRFVTPMINLSFPGWKSHRRAYPALISNSPVEFTIQTQDGRLFTYTVPSTAGKYRIIPTMLDQAIKDLAFLYQLDGAGQSFAFFPSDFIIETKEWREESYISLAIFKS